MSVSTDARELRRDELGAAARLMTDAFIDGDEALPRDGRLWFFERR